MSAHCALCLSVNKAESRHGFDTSLDGDTWREKTRKSNNNEGLTTLDFFLTSAHRLHTHITSFSFGRPLSVDTQRAPFLFRFFCFSLFVLFLVLGSHFRSCQPAKRGLGFCDLSPTPQHLQRTVLLTLFVFFLTRLNLPPALFLAPQSTFLASAFWLRRRGRFLFHRSMTVLCGGSVCFARRGAYAARRMQQCTHTPALVFTYG